MKQMRASSGVTVADKQNVHTKHIIISWVIFSILYWVCAYYKPMHWDEFFSWVYVERCSFKDILFLRDFGIGHPPLYHLLQKAARTWLPFSFPISLRFVNYSVGSVFVVLFVKTFLTRRPLPLFCYGVCCSSVILNAFVFSRMYGLVLLFSLLLFWSGERYRTSRSYGNLILLLAVFALGLCSDYNFVVLSPYLFLVLFARAEVSGRLQIYGLGLLFLLWVALTYFYPKDETLVNAFGFDFFSVLFKVGLAVSRLLFNFSYWELFLGAVFLAIVFSLLGKRNDSTQEIRTDGRVHSFLGFMMLLGVLCFFYDNDIIRLRYIAVIISLVGLIFLSQRKMFRSIEQENGRYLFTVAAGLLMIFVINPLFWGQLTEIRYVQVFIPFIYMLVYRNYSKVVLYALAAMLAVSGALYIPSNMIEGWYAPNPIYRKMPLIYQDSSAYSTQYFYDEAKGTPGPLFISMASLKKGCPVCEMGSEETGLGSYEEFGLVSKYGDEPDKLIPGGFKLVSREPLFSVMDEWFFRHLTPIENRRFLLSVYTKGNP